LTTPVLGDRCESDDASAMQRARAAALPSSSTRRSLAMPRLTDAGRDLGGVSAARNLPSSFAGRRVTG
jgi:hypothetical protein